MKIFLSYSSADQNEVEPIYYQLIDAGHDVFIDRKSLLPAEEFNAPIRNAIKNSELFIFIISPDSVRTSAYTLTELKFAEEKWPHPRGYVLPVMLHPTDYADIPNYLKAVSVLESKGSMAAEVGAWVAGKQQAKRKKQLLYTLIPLSTAILLAVVLSNFAAINTGQVEPPHQAVQTIEPGSSRMSPQPPQTTQTNTAQSDQGQVGVQFLQSFDEPYEQIPGIWQDASDAVWSSQIKDGRYCLTNPASPDNVRYVWQRVQPASNPQDMWAAVFVELLRPDYQTTSSSAGLIYSFNQSNEYYYAFTISADHRFHFYKKNAEGLNLVYSAIYDDDFGDTPIMLSMQRRDGMLELSINDEPVKTIQDDELAVGEYGIIGIGSGEYCFDNLMANPPE